MSNGAFTNIMKDNSLSLGDRVDILMAVEKEAKAARNDDQFLHFVVHHLEDEDLPDMSDWPYRPETFIFVRDSIIDMAKAVQSGAVTLPQS